MAGESSVDVANQALSGISFPPCPAVLMAVLKEVKRPNSDLGRVAQLIGQDIGLTAPILKLANSPFFGLRSKVNSVQQAVSFLGVSNTVNLLTNVSLRSNVGAGTQGIEKFWERSSLNANVSVQLAAKIPGMSRDDAYTMGLFHDCGIPILMRKYPDYEKTVGAELRQNPDICAIENKHYATHHGVVGHMLARTWFLPETICTAILYHHDISILTSPDARVSAEVCNLAAVIHMAECIVDDYLYSGNREWPQFKDVVLGHFELSEQDFHEIKNDVLAILNDE